MYAESKELMTFHARTKKRLLGVLSTLTDKEIIRNEVVRALRTGIDEYCSVTNDLGSKDKVILYYFDFYFSANGAESKQKEIDSIGSYLIKLNLDMEKIGFVLNQYKQSLVNLEEVINNLIEYRISEIENQRRQFALNEYYHDMLTELLICALGVIQASEELFNINLKQAHNAGAFVAVGNGHFNGLSSSGMLDFHSCDIWSSQKS